MFENAIANEVATAATEGEAATEAGAGEGRPDESRRHFALLGHREIMSERVAVSGPDPNDRQPECGGALYFLRGDALGDSIWTVYECAGCGQEIATIGGLIHSLNFVLRSEGAQGKIATMGPPGSGLSVSVGPAMPVPPRAPGEAHVTADLAVPCEHCRAGIAEGLRWAGAVLGADVGEFMRRPFLQALEGTLTLAFILAENSSQGLVEPQLDLVLANLAAMSNDAARVAVGAAQRHEAGKH